MPGQRRVNFINTLAPGRCGCNLKLVIIKLISMIGILSTSYENALMWKPEDLTDD